MLTLVFDSETTGLPEKLLPAEHPAQPHLVQLGALLLEDDGREVASVSLLARPEGWTFSPGAVKAHGITVERATACGVPYALVVAAFTNLRALADVVVAHNAPFDRFIMSIAIAQVGKKPANNGPASYRCTMDAATPIVNLPPTQKMINAGFNKPKPPSLTECYRHFFGEDLVGAHDALVDARACARVYQHLKSLGAVWRDPAERPT